MPAERLLLVDADEAFRNRMARALRDLGFEVEVASHVTSAKAAALARKPAFALIGMGLPGGSGLDLITDLHALNRGIRMLLLTEGLPDVIREEAIRRGAIGCLSKPLDGDEVVAALLGGRPDDTSSGDP